MENKNGNGNKFDINVSGLKFIQGFLMVMVILSCGLAMVGSIITMFVAESFGIAFGIICIILLITAVSLIYLLVPYFILQTVVDCMFNVQEQSKILLSINKKLNK